MYIFPFITLHFHDSPNASPSETFFVIRLTAESFVGNSVLVNDLPLAVIIAPLAVRKYR